MDKRALVVGASGGIGGAVSQTLTAHGYLVDGMSRSADGLDITDERSIADAFGPLQGEGRTYDLIFVATGALTVDGVGPERSSRDLDAATMTRSFQINAMGPALVFKHAQELMPRDRRVVFAALSARLASIGDNGLGGWMSYRAAKTALNQFLRCGSIEFGRKNKQAIVVALHPGTVPTKLAEPYARGRYTQDVEETGRLLVGVMEGLTADDTGQAFDYAGERIPW